MDILKKISYPHMMKIDGKAIRDEILKSLGTSVAGKKVAFIQMRDDLATESFVQAKLNVAARLGVLAVHEQHRPATTQDALNYLETIYGSGYDGVVIQLPLPDHIDTRAVLESIPQPLDIDLLSEASMRAFAEKKTTMTPPVAEAVRIILESVEHDLASKTIVIVGNGRLVGATLAAMFDRDNIPYTIFDKDSSQEEMLDALSRADIIISGVGRANMITGDMVRDGVILIDAGTSEESGVLSGDIDASCYPKAKAYTPVPGGVGPVTVAALFKNLRRNTS